MTKRNVPRTRDIYEKAGCGQDGRHFRHPERMRAIHNRRDGVRSAHLLEHQRGPGYQEDGRKMSIVSVIPNLYTANMDRAVTFYRDQLGGTQTFATPSEGSPEHVELRMGGAIVGLSNREAVPKQGLPEATAGHPLELVFVCDSTDDVVATLRAAGTPILVEPYTHISGHRRAYVADPDGNWIVIASKQSG